MTDLDTRDDWLASALAKISAARVAVFGDFCLDAYWLIDPDESERSVETSLPIRRVRRQRYSLGGAGNIVANLAALGVGSVRAVGLLGEDLFGKTMLELLGRLAVNCDGMLCCQDDWQTLVYAKPCVGEVEGQRIDFGGFNVTDSRSVDTLAGELARAAGESDVVILNQQVPGGASTPEMIERINDVVASHGDCRFIVDSRHCAGRYRGCMLKLNAHEAAALLGRARPLDERIALAEAKDIAARLVERTGETVFVTRGESGLLVADAEDVHDPRGVREIPGIEILERIDPVGAGDTIISAISAALASGVDAVTAASLANIAASVTVRKLQTTGTACPDEILAVGSTPDYVYLPELADDPRGARALENTEIEVVRELPGDINIRHAIFDHDGTISTLRHNWEQIMGPVMVRSILGPHYHDADEGLYHKVVDTVGAYIDKTTGIQTLRQMEGLIEMVKQFGCVPEADILDIHGYKKVYNDELLAMVSGRVAKLERGELDVGDFEMKNARALLERLAAAGVKLYLASGTDEPDVVREAAAMGYADLFEGRIFGASTDVRFEAKRAVLTRIFREHDLRGPEVVTFGDGPVEIRETRKRNGIAVGVATNEVCRFGLNPAKRTRLIRAGADLVIPDFSQLDRLLATIGIGGGTDIENCKL